MSTHEAKQDQLDVLYAELADMQTRHAIEEAEIQDQIDSLEQELDDGAE